MKESFMLSLSRLALAITLTVAAAAFVLLVQDVAPKNWPAADQFAGPPAEMTKIVPAKAARDTRHWHMATGGQSAN
jgi:hypothetical protein